MRRAYSICWRPILLLSALLGSMAAVLAQSEGAHYYFYLSDARIVTIEITDSPDRHPQLSSTSQIPSTRFSPLGWFWSTDEGNSHRGHLIEVENASYEAGRYKAFDLIKPNSFAGYTILGNFRFKAAPQAAYLKVGGRILELEIHIIGGL